MERAFRSTLSADGWRALFLSLNWRRIWLLVLVGFVVLVLAVNLCQAQELTYIEVYDGIRWIGYLI